MIIFGGCFSVNEEYLEEEYIEDMPPEDESGVDGGQADSVSAVPAFDQEAFFDRLSDVIAGAVPEVTQSDPADIAAAVVAALDEREAEQAQLMEGEEILVPGSEDIAVIKEVVQSILSFFQEDDHDVLSDIRDDVQGIRTYLEGQEAANADLHSMMTTSFTDYTVTEGLLLLILLCFFIRACAQMLKRGFSWLSW